MVKPAEGGVLRGLKGVVVLLTPKPTEEHRNLGWGLLCLCPTRETLQQFQTQLSVSPVTRDPVTVHTSTAAPGSS